MKQRYNFDRPGMAEGVAVHAESMEEAITAAIKLNGDSKVKFRDNQPCIMGCSICEKGIKCHAD